MTDRFDQDELLARFLVELGEAENSGGVLDAYCGHFPDLASELHALAKMQKVLDAAPESRLDELPSTLGDFRIVREIARGGMGIVYEAVQAPLDRRVAVKTIRRSRISPASRERFMREQKVLARLHQTHIVPIHAAGEEGALQYFAMPFITGAPLHQVVRTALLMATLRIEPAPVSLGQVAKYVMLHRNHSSEDATVSSVTIAGEPDSQPDNANGRDQTTTKIAFPNSYYRSVGEVICEVADAIQHAHDVGILHRDVKPSNLMIDQNGHSWIIDFGLAGFVDGRNVLGEPSCDDNRLPSALISGSLGTPQYMAPEQVDGKADVRTDVWGLGVTLYELLTLRRPFHGVTSAEVQQHIRESSPVPPEKCAEHVPRDLSAVCLKALQPHPEHRYQSARELCDDVRRYLQGDATRARPAHVARRVAIWTCRNKGWATVITLVFALLIAGFLTSVYRERASRREITIFSLQNRIAQEHVIGWSHAAAQAIAEAASTKQDNAVRYLAGCILNGIDATSQSLDFLASSAAFDATGEQVLFGGTATEPARRWNVTTGDVTAFGVHGPGPVAFGADGTLLQLVAGKPGEFVLVNLASPEFQSRFIIDSEGEAFLADDFWSRPPMSLDVSGSTVAASAWFGEKGVVRVWNAATGQSLLKVPIRATALAISPDREFLVIGEDDGGVSVWSIASQREVARLRSRGTRITCVQFGRRCLSASENQEPLPWNVASGDLGGNIVVWDPSRRVPISFCRGTSYRINAIAFSHDGGLLASGGRQFPRLWDVASGKQLLMLRTANTMTSIAFSPNAKKLAVVSTPAHLDPGGVDIYDFVGSRGVRTLRGLAPPIEKTVFSQDGQWVAALSHQWQVGIWSRTTGQLRQMIRVPKGFYIDSAAMAFDRAGQLFVFSAGTQVTSWKVSTGERVASWQLPPGLQDCLAFPSDNRLLVFRFEGKYSSGAILEQGSEDPPVCRLRDLMSPQPLIKEIPDFRKRVVRIVGDMNGHYFAVNGEDEEEEWVKVFDSYGREIWSDRSYNAKRTGYLSFDPTGRFVAYYYDNVRNITRLVDLELLQRRDLVRTCAALSPNMRFVLGSGEMEPGVELFDMSSDTSWYIGSSTRMGLEYAFSPDATECVWAQEDGTLSLCDIDESIRQLRRMGIH